MGGGAQRGRGSRGAKHVSRGEHVLCLRVWSMVYSMAGLRQIGWHWLSCTEEEEGSKGGIISTTAEVLVPPCKVFVHNLLCTVPASVVKIQKMGVLKGTQ